MKQIKMLLKMRSLIIIGIILIVIFLIMIISGSNRSGKPVMDKSITESIFTVKTDIVKKIDLQSYIEINGDVEANTRIDVYPDIGGKLSHLYVNLGSVVKKGQLVADVDPSKPGSIYTLSPVYAPISGTITSLPIRAGTTVTTSSTIVIISSINDLQINARIPERYVSVLKIGLNAEVTLEAYPGNKFSAKISHVSPVVDSISRTKQIYLVFDEYDNRINAGMFAKIKLNTVRYENRLTIPEESIVTNYSENYVFVLEDNMTVSKRIIEKGITVDGITEIASGIKNGEKIVVQGMRMLSNGSKVRDITETGGNK